MSIYVEDPEPELARRKRVLDALIEIICLDTSSRFKSLCIARFNEIQGDFNVIQKLGVSAQ